MFALRHPVRCPCGSGDRYADCCGPLHAGRAAGDPTARTAEQLMRSRYSAFAVGDTAYLSATWDPSTRPASIEPDHDIDWRHLEILETVDGGPADRRGVVEFVAQFREVGSGQFGQHRERSSFRRHAGQWYYVDAEPAS